VRVTVANAVTAALVVGVCTAGCAAKTPAIDLHAGAPASAPASKTAPEPDAATRIRFYSAKLDGDPGHYPSWALLGRAYLDRARSTLDPDDVARARAALTRSIAIQPSFDAFKLMAALSCFIHRFGDGLAWGRRAADAWPADTEVDALLVEAYLSLGRLDEAEAVLAKRTGSDDFHLTAARARILAARGLRDAAAVEYRRAASLATAQGHTGLASWARVSAAAVWIDAGDAARAKPLLEDAIAHAEEDRFLALHRAELLALEGDARGALTIYETLLRAGDNPELHRRAYSLAHALGDEDGAHRHFDAAEHGLRRALEAGEVYSLEELARLYADAGVHLDEALALATRNLEYKRDAGASATLAYVQARQPRS